MKASSVYASLRMVELLHSCELSVDCLYDIIKDFIYHSDYDFKFMYDRVSATISEHVEEGE